MENRSKFFAELEWQRGLPSLSSEEVESKRANIKSAKVGLMTYESIPNKFDVIITMKDYSAYKTGPYSMKVINEKFGDLLKKEEASKQEISALKLN